MRHLLHILFTLLLFLNCKAQDENVFKRLHGTVVKDNLFLRNNGTTSFQYKIDNETTWRDIKKGKLYNVSNNHDNTIGVYIKFYNPLKYNFKSSFKDVDDPVYQSLTQFLSSFPSMETLTAIEESASSEGQKKNTAAAYKRANLTDEDRRILKLPELNETILLYQWVFDFINNVDFTAIKTDTTSVKPNLYKALVNEINDQTKSIDDYLFRKITITFESGPEEKGLREWLSVRKSALFNCPSDYEKYNQEISISQKVEGGLEAAKARAEEGLKKLQKLLSEDFDARIRPLIITANTENFKKYSASTAFTLIVNSSAKMDTHKETLENFSKLVKSLSNFLADFNKDIKEYRLENQPSFDWKTTTMRNFTCEIKEIDIDGNEVLNKSLTSEFTVAKDQVIIPFVSTGIFYTDFHYPNYGIKEENGENIVAETDPTYVRVRPCVYLNMMFRSKSDWFYPYLQIGVSTGVNDFLIPFGGGLALSNNFSISGGSIFGLRKELTSLKIGAPVKDDASLKNDLSNKGFFSWYFSINYNFVKKEE